VVLRVDVISRYAGSLVQAARTNRVPALAQDHVLSRAMEFPGLAQSERLTTHGEERTILECVARLMVERGLCFDHQGLLVFPTLFNDLAEHEGMLPPSAPLYYDFNGPIDNIYASLVARLAVSEKFGPVRLWARYAEFGSEAEGTFGIRRADRSKGRGHVDLFFGGAIQPDRQRLFRDFVDDHLKSHGVTILSGLAFACRKCSFEFSEELLAGRLAEGKTEVSCPKCDERYSLFAAAQPATPESERNLPALKTDIDARTRESARKVVETLSHPKEPTREPLLVLHLSDLHFTADSKLDAVLQPLEADLRDVLKGKRLDYLVISGDFADKCNEPGWALAAQFVTEIRINFRLDALRIILAPGNHDLVRSDDYFTIERKLLGRDPQGKPVVGGEPKPNDKYHSRFHRFGTFYHNLYSARAYKEDPASQYDLIAGESGLYFLALNSAWQVDQYYPERASLNNDALSKALRELQGGRAPLGIAIWHHAAAGDRKIADTEATKRLADAGFRIVLHGDVHHERDDALHYLDDARRIHLIGSGSFGAMAKDRPESTPRSYSLLRIHRDLKTVEVERRHQRTAEGPYVPGPRWQIRSEGASDAPKPDSPICHLSSPEAVTQHPTPTSEPLQQIVFALAGGHCILHIGERLGSAAGLPPWPTILDIILRRLSSSGIDLDAQAAAALGSASFRDGLELLSAQADRKLLAGALREAMAPTMNPDLDLVQLIATLPFRGIVTDHFGGTVERLFEDFGGLPLLPQDDQALAQHLTTNTPFLLYLNGRADDPESIILSRKEYQRLTDEHPEFQRFVTSILTSNSVVFFGSSLDAIERLFLAHRITTTPARSHFAFVIPSEHDDLHRRPLSSSYSIKVIMLNSTDSEESALLGTFRQLRSLLPAFTQVTENTIPELPISSIELRNIGPFVNKTLEFHRDVSILLGNNGCGKTVLLRAIALALCSYEGDRVEQAALSLLRRGTPSGHIELRSASAIYRTDLVRDGARVRVRPRHISPLQIGRTLFLGFPAIRGAQQGDTAGIQGDFESSTPNIYDLLPLVTGTGDNRIHQLKEWLLSQRSQLRGIVGSGEVQQQLKPIIAEIFEVLGTLMPDLSLRFSNLDENASEVIVQTADGLVPVDLLSHGTTSLLLCIGVLIRRLHEIYRMDSEPAKRHIVLLIDEIDTHLHPAWQLTLIPRLIKHFPKMQLIATTHSPLVVMGLDEESVYRVVRVGDTTEPDIRQYEMKLKGREADDLLASPLFGLEDTRDASTQQDEIRYVELCEKAVLSDDERAERDELEMQLYGPRGAYVKLHENWNEEISKISKDAQLKLLRSADERVSHSQAEGTAQE
jgi:predicted ATP-binding protein involved in virulence